MQRYSCSKCKTHSIIQRKEPVIKVKCTTCGSEQEHKVTAAPSAPKTQSPFIGSFIDVGTKGEVAVQPAPPIPTPQNTAQLDVKSGGIPAPAPKTVNPPK